MKESSRAHASWDLPTISLGVALAVALLALCAALLGPTADLVPAPAATAIGEAEGPPYCLPAPAVALSRRREST
jgi:hypothetical protein